MYTNFDLDLFKKLGNEKRISQIVEENFNNESEFYSWWNENTNSNNELRTGLLIDNTKEFVLKREEHGIPRIQAESDENKGKEYQTFGEMNDNTRGVLRIGSAALALSYLACGRIDGFWVKGLHEWDIAGGLALVREAGGQLSDMNGNTFVIGASTLVASNNYIHKPLLRKIDNFFVKT